MSAPEAKTRTLKGPVIIVLAIIVFLALGVLLNPLPKPAELAILDRPATAADTLPDGYDAAELERGGFKKVHGNIYAVSTERVPGSR